MARLHSKVLQSPILRLVQVGLREINSIVPCMFRGSMCVSATITIEHTLFLFQKLQPSLNIYSYDYAQEMDSTRCHEPFHTAKKTAETSTTPVLHYLVHFRHFNCCSSPMMVFSKSIPFSGALVRIQLLGFFYK